MDPSRSVAAAEIDGHKLKFVHQITSCLRPKTYRKLISLWLFYIFAQFSYEFPSICIVLQVKIWFQNRRSKVKKMMKQHQHSGNVTGSAPSAGGTSAGQGPPGGSSNGDQQPSHLLQSSARDCWSQPASHHAMHAGSRVNDDTGSPTDHDDEHEEISKKPLHLLQLNSSIHRFSPHDSHPIQIKNGSGSGPMTSQLMYRNAAAQSPPLHRYHSGSQHEMMTSSISGWSDPEVHGALQHSQQQRMQGIAGGPGNHLTYSGGSTYMMASPDMTSPYPSSWFPHTAADQPPTPHQHHLSTLLS